MSAGLGIAQDDGLILPAMERELEEWRHVQLARIQRAGEQQEFISDGCSGGLSDGWRLIAQRMPAFAEKFGDKPPYEACCIEHDRAYWQGDTVEGFDKRLAADLALRDCVNQYGKMHSHEYAERLGLSEATIEANFTLSAGLMFRAVRVGGVPCTGLPWRWGYGWPPCADVRDDR